MFQLCKCFGCPLHATYLAIGICSRRALKRALASASLAANIPDMLTSGVSVSRMAFCSLGGPSNPICLESRCCYWLPCSLWMHIWQVNSKGDYILHSLLFLAVQLQLSSNQGLFFPPAQSLGFNNWGYTSQLEAELLNCRMYCGKPNCPAQSAACAASVVIRQLPTCPF